MEPNTNDNDGYNQSSYPPNSKLTISYLKGLLENKIYSEISENLDLGYYTICFVEMVKRREFEESIHNSHTSDDYILRRFKLNNNRLNIKLSSSRATRLSNILKNRIGNKVDELSIHHPEKIYQPSKLDSPTVQDSVYYCYYYVYKSKSKSINKLLFRRLRDSDDEIQANNIIQDNEYSIQNDNDEIEEYTHDDSDGEDDENEEEDDNEDTEDANEDNGDGIETNNNSASCA